MTPPISTSPIIETMRTPQLNELNITVFMTPKGLTAAPPKNRPKNEPALRIVSLEILG